MRPACKTLASTFFEADVCSSHTSECARRLGLACWSSSSWGTTNPRCLTSGPAPPMGAWRTRLSGAPAEAARPGACQELLCGGFGAHYCVLFDAGPLRPMHGRSGAAVRACFDCKPSVGTCVLASVSAFGGCSFALGTQHVKLQQPACCMHQFRFSITDWGRCCYVMEIRVDFA